MTVAAALAGVTLTAVPAKAGGGGAARLAAEDGMTEGGERKAWSSTVNGASNRDCTSVFRAARARGASGADSKVATEPLAVDTFAADSGPATEPLAVDTFAAGTERVSAIGDQPTEGEAAVASVARAGGVNRS
mmetsp:Transcript_2512/g.4237  ORF Transcript_2512/g.4237 Transcript_2512/m.4237 type:complete len:133 (-) Transcript_2512:568-966(-)